LRARVEAVVEAFRERGGRPLDAQFVAFVPPGEARVARVQVERAQCLGLTAVGVRALRKVSLRVHDRAGVLLGEQSNEATPYLRLCTGERAALTVVLRALEGQGQLALLVVAQPPVVAPELDRILGEPRSVGLSGPRSPRAAVGADPTIESAADVITRHRARLTQLGYRPLSEPSFGQVERSEPTALRFELEAGRCYGVLVATDSDDEPVSLELRDPDGRIMVAPRLLDRDPLVRGCIARSGTYQLRLSTTERARFAAQVLLLEERIHLPPDLTGELRAGVLELYGEAVVRSLRRPREVRRFLATSAPLVLAIDLARGDCALVGVAASGAPVELSLTDARGALIAADIAGQAIARVWHCAARDQRLRISARSAASRGEFALVVFDDRSSS
jgi:hypothetical protein